MSRLLISFFALLLATQAAAKWTLHEYQDLIGSDGAKALISQAVQSENLIGKKPDLIISCNAGDLIVGIDWHLRNNATDGFHLVRYTSGDLDSGIQFWKASAGLDVSLAMSADRVIEDLASTSIAFFELDQGDDGLGVAAFATKGLATELKGFSCS